MGICSTRHALRSNSLDTQFTNYRNPENINTLIQQRQTLINLVQQINPDRNELRTTLSSLDTAIRQKGSIYDEVALLNIGQQVLLALGEIMIQYRDILETTDKDSLFKFLTVLMEREEFKLSEVGFLNHLPNAISSSIAVSYRNLLNKCVLLAMSKYVITSSVAERLFATKLLVHSYFRLPDMREQLIKSFAKNLDTLPLLDLEGRSHDVFRNNAMFVDWEFYFHKHLPKYDRIHLSSGFQELIDKKSGAYLQFLKEWVGYVRNLIIDPTWVDIPGYKTFVKSVLKFLQVNLHSDALLDSIGCWSANDRVFNQIIQISFSRTKLHDGDSVVKTFDLLNACLASRKVLIKFDYGFLLTAVKMVLSTSENAFAIAKVLQVLYMHFLVFSLEFRRNLCEFILEGPVFRLLLHWSPNVRYVIQHFLVFRIYHQHRNPKLSAGDEDSIVSHYNQLKQQKQQSFFDETTHQHLHADYIYVRYLRCVGAVTQMALELMKEPQKPEANSMYQHMAAKLKDRSVVQRPSNARKTFTILDSQHREESVLLIHEDQLCDMETPIISSFRCAGDEDSHKRNLFKQKQLQQKAAKSEPQFKLTKDQLRYIRQAHKEYEETMKAYLRWRQAHISKSFIVKQIKGSTTPISGEHLTLHLNFIVPDIVIYFPVDEKDHNTLVAVDEW